MSKSIQCVNFQLNFVLEDSCELNSSPNPLTHYANVVYTYENFKNHVILPHM